MTSTKKAPQKKAAPKTTAKAAKTSSTSAAKESPTPSALKEEWRTAGTDLAKLFQTKGVDATAAKAGATMAGKLADGTATNADLIELREAVKATAAALREADQLDVAKQFSESNYLVRRAERATRAK